MGNVALGFLKSGYCVIAVDANPLAAGRARKLLSSETPTQGVAWIVINVGVAQSLGDLTFWQTKIANGEHSSFDYDKAHREDPRNVRAITVPTVRCSSIMNVLGTRSVYWLKVDIEERHYLCIKALQELKPKMLPRYVSWEMHEHSHGSKWGFPLLDVDLMIQMYRLGYPDMKYVSNLWGRRGSMPEDFVDVMSRNQSWVLFQDILRRGFPNPRRYRMKYDWWDYHMRLNYSGI